jgi:orotidine 5'-phosphate decarboxylase, subfamily 1
LLEEGYEVFVDLKLHDIPNTVARAAKVIGSLGASYLTVHCSGGVAMLQAALEGFEAGTARAGLTDEKLIGVTVLTSEADASVEVLRERLHWAEESGCAGVVAAAVDLAVIEDLAPRLIRVVPGIRLEGTERHDQKRIATPGQAIAAGANLLVIGRNVTESNDPEGVAAKIYATVESARSGK